MKTSDIKIGTQLKTGFGLIMFFVLCLWAAAFIQNTELHDQTSIMYNHPLQVRKALGDLRSDILSIRVSIRDLMLSDDENEKKIAKDELSLHTVNAELSISVMKEKYLGPADDIKEMTDAYYLWLASVNENIALINDGLIEVVEVNISTNGITGIKRKNLDKAIEKIDIFAANKAKSLQDDSERLKDRLVRDLILLTLIIFILSVYIIFIVMKNIRRPLKIMNDAVMRFHEGDMSSRSTFDSKNEFGLLSESINKLADAIENSTDLDIKTVKLSDAMLREDDAQNFFRSMLLMLIDFTDAQIASVYLLSDDKTKFTLYESVGLSENARKSFDVVNPEGEFGRAVTAGKITVIRDIPDDTRFALSTSVGDMIPREIMTIPVVSADATIAVISIASITKFSEHSINFINRINVTLSARIEGILAYQRIKDFKNELERQNAELEANKSELAMQAVELMQQNTELEMQKNQLNEVSRLKTNFLSNISHELRTPLNSVIALSGVLSRKLAGKIHDEEYSYLEIIERNGKNLLHLINDILDISRIEAGREEIDVTKFKPDGIVTDVITMVQPLANQKNIEIIHEPCHDEIFVTSDSGKVRHILQNLIGNAIKFTEKGTVKIATVLSDNNIDFIVTDTGIGIAEDQITYIFDEFRQADGSTSRRFGGSGLGLAIAKKYAVLLGGDITVSSTPGVGSEFKLTLPANFESYTDTYSESDGSISDEAPIEVAHDHYKKDDNAADRFILLVDDNESAIIQLNDLVTEMGYKVKAASNAEEAFDIIATAIPDAMVLDLMMPGIDGFKVLETLRNAEPTAHTPVLILTSKHISKDELKFLKRNNIHQLIQKGDVDRQRLQHAIQKMIYKNDMPKILVVEDNNDNLTTVKAMLGSKYVIIDAFDGCEGVEKAKSHIPDLILMDIALSGMNGIDAFKEIRNNAATSKIPVIALTASAMTHEKETILSYGFDGYISKPIIAKEFYSVIEKVLYGK